MAEAFDPFASGQATEVAASPEAAFDPFATGEAVPVVESKEPTSNGFSDFAQRLGENLWKGLGNLSSGLERLDERIGLSPTEESYRKNMARAGNKVDPKIASELKRRDEDRKTHAAGQFLQSVADTGSRRTDPNRDAGMPALAADIIGGAAPAFLLGPGAPVGMGAMISDQERQRALSEGQSQEEAQARGDLGFSVGTAAGLIPVVGKSIVTKAITGGLGNAAGDVAIEAAQGRTPEAESLVKSAGIGALFGAGMGVQERVAARPKQPSLVTQMDGATKGTPTAANVQANEIAMRPIEPVAPVAEAAPAPAPATPVAAEVAPVEGGPITAQDVAKMNPDEFTKHFQQEGVGLTDEAIRIGQETTDPKAIDDLKAKAADFKDQFKKAMEAEDYELAGKVAYQEQFFNEAYQTATKTGAFAEGQNVVGGPEVKATPQEAVIEAKAYLDELLATKEITAEEHAEQLAQLAKPPTPPAVSPQVVAKAAQPPASPVEAPAVQTLAANPVPKPVVQPAALPPGTPPPPPGQIPAPAPSMNNPIPNQGWTPFISATKAGQFIKEKIGTIEGNIRAADPEVFGSLRERGFKVNELKYDWSNESRGYGENARRYLKPEAFTELDRLLQSGLHNDAEAFIKGSKYEAELKQEITKFKATLDAIRQAEINAGRDVGDLKNYWVRQVADYEGLRKELGKDPSHAAEKALKAAAERKKTPLTPDEEVDVINNLISTSFSGNGKPGFLNKRTIGEIQKNWFKYYEPSDVAIENRINRAASDVVNRAYFGKFDPAGLAAPMRGNVGAIEGSFGEIIKRHLANKTLSPEASRVVVQNLQDFLRADSGFNEVNSILANKLRKAQTYGYLSDLSSAIPQFGDFFISAQRNGFLDAGKGFTNRPIKLQDIKLHAETPDTAIYSKRNREGLVGKVFRNAVQTSIGIADGFNKRGSINTSFHEAARDMNNPNSDTYKRLDRKWSERFPNRWPEIKKDLQGQAFQKGQLNPNTQFFLYSELADIQPLSGESYAQGYHQAGPFGKILYGLRSFAIKQLDVMREMGYENMRSKDPARRAEGLKNLVTYALIVGIGQQFLSSYGRDLLFSRDTEVSEYALSGLMSLVGLNRYFIYRSGDVGAGTAALETLVPGVGIANDIGQSTTEFLKYATNQRNTKTGILTSPTLPDALQKMNVIKYIPFGGRAIDAYLGPGASRQQKRDEDKAKGKPQKSTLQQIQERLIPPDTKS